MNAARTPLAAQARSRSGLAAAGVQTKTRSASPSGRSSIDAHGVARRAPRAPSRLVAKTLPAVAGGEDVVEARRSRTCPGGSTRRRRSRPAGRTAPGSARSVRRSASSDLDQRVDGHRLAVDDDERVEVGRRRSSGRPRPRPTGRAARRRPRRGRRPARPGTGRAAPACARSSIISSASTRLIGTSRKADVGHRLGQDPADAEHHGHAELRIAARARRSARGCRASIGATSTPTSPSSGVAAASSSAAAARDRCGVGEARAARARARSCGRWRRRPAWPPPGSRSRRPRSPRRRRRATTRSARDRARRSRRGAPSSRAPTGSWWRSAAGRARLPTLLSDAARPPPPTPLTVLPPGAIRASSRASTGPPGRWDDRVEVGRCCAARGMTALRVRAEGRPDAPPALARPLRPRGARRLRGDGRRQRPRPRLRHLARARHRRLQLRRPQGPAGQGRPGRRPRRRAGHARLRRHPVRPVRGSQARRPWPATWPSTSPAGRR